MKKTALLITFEDGRAEERSGWATDVPGLACYKGAAWWVLVHAPSGRYLWWLRKRDHCAIAADRLDGLADWSLDAETLHETEGLSERACAALREVREEVRLDG